MLRCEALCLLGGQNGLTFRLGLPCYFGQALGLGLACCFGCLGGESSGNLGFFLGLALRFLLQALAFNRLRLFDALAGFFPRHCPGGGKIAVLGSMQIGPGIERGYIFRSFVLVSRRFRSRVGFGHTHLKFPAESSSAVPETRWPFGFAGDTNILKAESI